MKKLILQAAILVFAMTAGPVAAQDQDETLADVRQELTVLYVEIQRLKRELSTTSGAALVVGGETALERIDLIEGELIRLTAQTERLGNRIDRIVRDGTNRIGDLEFRLVELEGGDLSTLGETTTLGGDTEGFASIGTTPSDNGVELAVGEQGDYDRAKSAFDDGDYSLAAERFAAFTQTYPAGPLSGLAHFYRGESMTALGDGEGAARAYLDSFSGQPDGEVADGALLGLGRALASLNQVNEACITIGEIAVRFPQSELLSEAEAERLDLGCN